MTKTDLLEAYKAFTKDVVKGLFLPVQPQREDKKPPPLREPEVHIMGLGDYKSAKKKAPYIIHQVITGRDTQETGRMPESQAVVRSVFAVYHENDQQGMLALLELIERLRIALLREQVLRGQFTLDIKAGVEYLIYPDNLPPFYAGEMVSTWDLPPIEREGIGLWP